MDGPCASVTRRRARTARRKAETRPPGGFERFRSFDIRLYAFADPQGAAAEVKAEGLIKSSGRVSRQDYVVFLRASGNTIAFLREYFDPVRAAYALDTPILGLAP